MTTSEAEGGEMSGSKVRVSGGCDGVYKVAVETTEYKCGHALCVGPTVEALRELEGLIPGRAVRRVAPNRYVVWDRP